MDLNDLVLNQKTVIKVSVTRKKKMYHKEKERYVLKNRDARLGSGLSVLSPETPSKLQ